MIYISPENEYPRHIGDIQIQYPDFKEGDELPDGWVKVEESNRPEVEAGKVAYEGFPEDVNGTITQKWIIRDLTDEEIARRNAPETAKTKLFELGFTDLEIQALVNGLIR